MPDNSWFGGDEATDLCTLKRRRKKLVPCHLHQAVTMTAWMWLPGAGGDFTRTGSCPLGLCQVVSIDFYYSKNQDISHL